MDESVKRALAKWPNVPNCYGWLGLDQRGNWLMRGERVSNIRLIDFINRNYFQNEAGENPGAWVFQNGPQKVFVELAYTPWIFRLDAISTTMDAISTNKHAISTTGLPQLQLTTHTGDSTSEIQAVFIDDSGSLLLLADCGIGLLDDRDAETALNSLCTADGNSLGHEDLLAAIEQLMRQAAKQRSANAEPITALYLQNGAQRIAVQAIKQAELETHFNYRRSPQAPAKSA